MAIYIANTKASRLRARIPPQRQGSGRRWSDDVCERREDSEKARPLVRRVLVHHRLCGTPKGNVTGARWCKAISNPQPVQLGTTASRRGHMRARISRRHSLLLGRGEDRVDGLLVQSCDELSLFVETLSMFVADRLRRLRRNASKLLDDDKQPAALLRRETTVAELAVVRQLKTASISRLGSARELRCSRAIDLGSLVVALLWRDRDAMLARPSLVTNAALGVLIWRRLAHPARLVTIDGVVHVPLVAVGASQHAAAVISTADPVARVVDLELEAELAKALHSLPGRVAIDLKCVAHKVVRQPSERVEIASAVRRRGRGVCWRIGTAGLLKMNLTSHLRVGADPSHFDVSLERLRRVHERLVLAQTLLKSGGHERIVLGEIDDLGDLLAVLVPGRVKHTGVAGEVVVDLRLEVTLDVHGLGRVVCGHKLEQLHEQPSGMMRVLRGVLLDEVPQSLRRARSDGFVDFDVPLTETLRVLVGLVVRMERFVREEVRQFELVGADVVVVVSKNFERTRELRAFEQPLDAGEELDLDLRHGPGKPHVEPTHS